MCDTNHRYSNIYDLTSYAFTSYTVSWRLTIIQSYQSLYYQEYIYALLVLYSQKYRHGFNFGKLQIKN